MNTKLEIYRYYVIHFNDPIWRDDPNHHSLAARAGGRNIS